MQKKITTFLTFDGRAEEAVDFYTGIFATSKITSTRRYGAAWPGPEGSLMTATFELAGQEFMALNGGPSFTFSQGISLFVDCGRRTRSTISGRSSPRGARKARAAG